jgi:hypothetical protein
MLPVLCNIRLFTKAQENRACTAHIIPQSYYKVYQQLNVTSGPHKISHIPHVRDDLSRKAFQ